MSTPVIRELESHRGYPAVSLFLPTHRTQPDRQQDAILLKNLVREAEERLRQEMPAREAAPVLDALAALAGSVDHEHNLEGLALFASVGRSRIVRLPFKVAARVQIDETFAVRDLVSAFNRSPHYLVLAIEEQATRLWSGHLDVLEEVNSDQFPLAHDRPGGVGRQAGGHGVNPSALRDAHRRTFVRAIDLELGTVLKSDDSPLVVVGTDEYLADFESESKHTDRVIGRVKGSHGHLSGHDLGALVWPVAEAGFAVLRAENLARLDAAVGANQYASGIVQVWEAATQGRVDLLIVEDEFRQPAVLPEAGGLPRLVDDPADPASQDDLVDHAIQATLSHGGRVSFVDAGTLAVHDRIGAVLRY